MKLAGTQDRAPGEEWRDTLGILANLPNNIAAAVVKALEGLQK